MEKTEIAPNMNIFRFSTSLRGKVLEYISNNINTPLYIYSPSNQEESTADLMYKMSKRMINGECPVSDEEKINRQINGTVRQILENCRRKNIYVLRKSISELEDTMDITKMDHIIFIFPVYVESRFCYYLSKIDLLNPTNSHLIIFIGIECVNTQMSHIANVIIENKLNFKFKEITIYIGECRQEITELNLVEISVLSVEVNRKAEDTSSAQPEEQGKSRVDIESEAGHERSV